MRIGGIIVNPGSDKYLEKLDLKDTIYVQKYVDANGRKARALGKSYASQYEDIVETTKRILDDSKPTYTLLERISSNHWFINSFEIGYDLTDWTFIIGLKFSFREFFEVKFLCFRIMKYCNGD